MPEMMMMCGLYSVVHIHYAYNVRQFRLGLVHQLSVECWCCECDTVSEIWQLHVDTWETSHNLSTRHVLCSVIWQIQHNLHCVCWQIY